MTDFHSPPQSHPQPPFAPSIPYAQMGGGGGDKDAEHLRLLALFHYIGGGMIALFASFGLLHVGFGIMMLVNPNAFPSQGPSAPPPPPFMGWMMLIMGSVIVLLGWSAGAATIVSGRLISRRRAWLFSMIVAGLNCLWMPIGTILGVFTFIVLLRPTVKAAYESNKTATSP
jgi:hypothetical protein